MSCNSRTAVKPEGWTISYVDPTGTMDFSDYGAELKIAAAEGSPPLLTVGLSATPNGSSIVVAPSAIVVTVTPADLDTLPDGSPVTEPWVGVFQLMLTSVGGEKILLDSGAFVLKKGI